MVLDTLHFGLISHTVYFYMVTNFGDYETLSRTVWSFEVQVGVAEVLTVLVQT